MPFTVSPGVSISEIDLTNIVPPTSTITGAFAGVFKWGPVDKPTLVDSTTLKSRFGAPDENTYLSYYSASNFMSYGAASYITRVANTSALNATTSNTTYNATVAGETYLLKNRDDYEALDPDSGGVGLPTTYGPFIAKYPGERGNSLRISICSADIEGLSSLSGTVSTSSGTLTGTNTSFTDELVVGTVLEDSSGNKAVVSAISDDVTATIVGEDLTGSISRLKKSAFKETKAYVVGTITTTINRTSVTGSGTAFTLQVNEGDYLTFDDETTEQVLSIQSDTALTLASGANKTRSSVAFGRKWEYADNSTFTSPSTTSTVDGLGGSRDAINVAIINRDNNWFSPDGSQATYIQSWNSLSVSPSNTNDYYKTVLNNSDLVWFLKHPSGQTTWGDTATNGKVFDGAGSVYTYNFNGGADGNVVEDSDLLAGFQTFNSSTNVDISLLYAGSASASLASSIIDIAKSRKDCVAFVSPELSDIRGVSSSTAVENIIDFRNSLGSTSYAVMDSGWKKQIRFNEDAGSGYRLIPLNPDIAGICARTEADRGAFFSPGGFQRGGILSVVDLVFNPDQTSRDELYRNSINPVVTFANEGTVLFGDKTLLSSPTAFDRINVRRLFISLERSISRAARSYLFEFNDEFTRSQFVSIVTPFLRNIQSRGGITDFAVICDGTNNPPSVVDSNQFVGSVFVKPARSINFIELNFVAVRSDVAFNEVVQSI